MREALRVLAVVANPADLPRFDDARVWREIAGAVEPLRAAGSLVIERLEESTEAALRRRLAQGACQVLHLVVHSQDRAAANYGTIALQSSAGGARNLTAAYLASLLAASPTVKLVVLQACDESSRGFSTVARALVEQGLTVVIAPPLRDQALRVFASKLYAGLAAGLSPGAVARDLAAAVRGESIQVLSRNPDEAVAAPPSAAPPPVARTPAPEPAPSAEDGWRKELERKRTAGQFDVFLCHNWADKPAVKRIAQRLKEAGILPWLDAWELPPGQPWQPLLEQQIGSIRSAAVFVGSAGLGPWQEQEMYGFLREFARRKVPVIPVLLPDAPSTPELPLFLAGMTWVDFRSSDPDPLKSLIWGITGRRPED